MIDFSGSFRRANKEMNAHYGRMGEKKLLSMLDKSICPCTDDFSKKLGMRYTVGNNKTGGSILHFKSKSDVLFYLIDCAIIRNWVL